MSHPITSRRRSLVIYILVWFLIFAINAAIIYFLQGFAVKIAIADSFISNFVFAVVGLLAWYPTRYIPYQQSSPVYSIMAHIVAGLLVILVWLTVTVGLLTTLHYGNDLYKDFLNRTLFWRGVVGSLFYLVLVLVFYLVVYAKNLKERAQAEERLKTLVRESELNVLKSQINPHFLFNSLNSISSLTMSSPDEAHKMIIRLSDLLRYSLKNRENEFVTLEEEIGRMQDYLAIEKIRFGEKLRYNLSVPQSCKKIELPTMILQPLIENAIKHGVYESVDPVDIEFNCVMHTDFLELSIVNDYDPDQPPSRGTGLGLQNVTQRILLAYEGKGHVDAKGENGKYNVRIFIPVKKAKKP